MVESVKKGKKNKQPAPPFITSTVAARKLHGKLLGFQGEVATMKAVAGAFTKAWNIEGHGLPVGSLITYMPYRLSLSAHFRRNRRAGGGAKFIGERWGKRSI